MPARCLATSSIANMQNDSAHVILLNMLECIGIDNRRHFCVSHEDTTLCGVKVKSKKDRMTGYHDDHFHYNCYKCDAKLDELADAEDIELRSTKNV
ncbi:MAG: hypothetical protein WC358_10570 [Ignavibacteria bacterium]